jgi:putative ABC transport system substrate-binding protein
MKKILVLILCVTLAISAFTACGKKKEGFTVGICNYVDDASLNQICDNIKTQLEKIAKDNNITINVKYDNCNADANVMNQIISNFIADKVDVMIGVATPVAMAMQSATEDNKIPVIFAAVSDPLGAGLVDSLAAPGHNITGTSDALDTDAVLKLITAAKPDIKKVGLLYDQGQDASTAAIKAAKEFLNAKGITVVERTGTNNDEVILAAQALVADGVEAVFTPTDNTIMTSELAIYEIFANAKIPQYCGADSFALNGAFLGYGVNYANLGVETANMVKELLVDGKKPETLAVKTFDNGTATINTETCEKIGFVYDDIVKAFTPFCSKIQTIKTADKFE